MCRFADLCEHILASLGDVAGARDREGKSNLNGSFYMCVYTYKREDIARDREGRPNLNGSFYISGYIYKRERMPDLNGLPHIYEYTYICMYMYI
jgi:hypothetical protein